MRFIARASLLLVVLACGSGLPVPSYVQQRALALAPVPYPPPPARVEFIPNQPAGGAVWIDGEWVWRGRRWSWRQGRWVTPPTAARFSPWAMVRGDDGTIYYASGVWRDAKDEEVPEPQPLSTAKPSSGEVVNPEGERENTGQIVRQGVHNAPPSASGLAPTGAPSPSPSPSMAGSGALDSGTSSDANPDGGVGP